MTLVDVINSGEEILSVNESHLAAGASYLEHRDLADQPKSDAERRAGRRLRLLDFSRRSSDWGNAGDSLSPNTGG